MLPTRLPALAVLLPALLLLGCHSSSTPAQAATPAPAAGTVPESSRGCRTPVSDRESEAGCFLTASATVGPFTETGVYWHLYTYPTRAAAVAARGPQGTVVGSFDRNWVYTIADSNWKPPSGEKVAVIGPLAVVPGARWTARYMEAVFPPGFRTAPVGHRHSGAEAWYVLTGAQCLETPDSLIIARAGEGALVPAGPPMAISGYGEGTRTAVLIVLHPPDESWVSPATDWKPAGRCGR